MKKPVNTVFSIAYLAMAIPMFYLMTGGFTLGGFGFEYKYLLGLGIVFLALIHFLITADLPRAVRCLQDSLVLSRPYLWTLAYSLVLWAVTMAGFRVITRGAFYIGYQLIGILAAAAALYMFGRKAMYLQTTALAAALILLAVEQIRQVGMGTFFNEYITNILTFTGQSGYTMRAFEKLGHCEATGFCLLYFLLTGKENKKHYLWALLCLFLFFLGLKRSVTFGLGVAVVLFLLLSRAKNPQKWIKPLAVLLLGLTVAYIIWVYYGMFDMLEEMGMNTSGRNWLYAQIKQYYYLSPAYFGKGAGFVANAFSSGLFDTTNQGFTIGDIHNDYLRQYIDYGFFAFLVWQWLFTANRMKYFFYTGTEAIEKRRGIIAFSMIAMICIMFMTENALYYYYATIFSSLGIMSYQFETFAERTPVLKEEV